MDVCYVFSIEECYFIFEEIGYVGMDYDGIVFKDINIL